MTHIRTEGKSYDASGKHNGPGPWLAVIHAANMIAPGTFGEPDSYGPAEFGGIAEEYPAARVWFREDGSVSIISKTEDGARILAGAKAACEDAGQL